MSIIMNLFLIHIFYFIHLEQAYQIQTEYIFTVFDCYFYQTRQRFAYIP